MQILGQGLGAVLVVGGMVALVAMVFFFLEFVRAAPWSLPLMAGLGLLSVTLLFSGQYLFSHADPDSSPEILARNVSEALREPDIAFLREQASPSVIASENALGSGRDAGISLRSGRGGSVQVTELSGPEPGAACGSEESEGLFEDEESCGGVYTVALEDGGEPIAVVRVTVIEAARDWDYSRLEVASLEEDNGEYETLVGG